MFTISRLLALTLLVALLFNPMHQHELRLLDLPAAMFVCCGAAVVALLRCEARDCIAAIQVLISGRAAADADKLIAGRRWYKASAAGTLFSGLVGGLINLICVLFESASYPNGAAVSLLYVLYGIVLSQFFFGPLGHAIDNRIECFTRESHRSRTDL